ncbi:Phage-related protein [uncultured Clostridium sp.]|uniref:phage tail protein n=1 Tax=uncultured Clostridium sp. TaxID=59620 RepID=UPI00082322F3|nr:phage tail protein [uncultured Clostridium sp.]SCJ99150.1 Phage-related protein [uncultured Clostridium sp.]
MADGRIIIDTEIDNSGAEKGVKNLSGKLGSLAKTGATVLTGLVAAASVAVTGLTTLAVKQYAEYEQLVGGVETLFKDSSDMVKKYADNAYKTAGLSANEYMSTITGFTASLLQGLGGDTKKAAEIANQAITDMSDNANKMGTSMEMIQNAYQGFAKQNYTMLDNLKLGYGGTKEEMKRLLEDATKLSGIEYSIGNFSDIIEAIHVVQTELGITGTTALEASTTIEGSLNTMKSAWSNMLTAFADEESDFDTAIQNLFDSVMTFGDNILPRIGVVLDGIVIFLREFAYKIPEIIMEIIPGVITSGGEVVGALIGSLMDAMPLFISAGVELIKTLIDGVKTGMPLMVEVAFEAIGTLVDAAIEVLPLLLDLGFQLLAELGRGIAESLPTLIPTIVNLVISMCDMIIENLPLILDVAIDIILALVQGLINALPTLIAEVPRIINSFANAIYGALPQILKAGIDILLMLIKGLIDSIPTLIANIPQIIMAIVNAITLYNWAGLGKNLINWLSNGISSMKGNIGNIAKGVAEWVGNSITNIFKGGLSWGKNLISSIGQGFSSMVSFLGNSARSVATSALNAIKNIFTGGFDIGKNLIQGIWNGISNMKQWILDKIGGFAGSIISGIKDFFGIHSPSRVMRDLIGINIVKGIGVGVDIETPNLEKDIDSNMADLVAKMKGTVDYETTMTTARVVAYNNSLSGGVEEDTKESGKQVIENHIQLIVEGKEVAYAIAPYQDILAEYDEGR